jgi:hypothetical protein
LDNVDFLAGEYPRTREQATDALLDCVNQLRVRLGEGVDSAAELLDAQGQVVADEVSLVPKCRFGEASLIDSATGVTSDRRLPRGVVGTTPPRRWGSHR